MPLVVGVAEDFGAGVDQRPQRGLLADDFGIVDGVGRVGDRLGDLGQIGRAADGLEIARLRQALDQQRACRPACPRRASPSCARRASGWRRRRSRRRGRSARRRRTDCGSSSRLPNTPFLGLQVLRRQPVEDFGSNAAAGGVGGVSTFGSGHSDPCSAGGNARMSVTGHHKAAAADGKDAGQGRQENCKAVLADEDRHYTKRAPRRCGGRTADIVAGRSPHCHTEPLASRNGAAYTSRLCSVL